MSEHSSQLSASPRAPHNSTGNLAPPISHDQLTTSTNHTHDLKTRSYSLSVGFWDFSELCSI